MKTILTAAIVGGALLTSACATDPYGQGYGYRGPPRVSEGTAAGLGIGALGGCILAEATDGSCLTGAALGAVVGGAVGYYRDRGECRDGYCGEQRGVRVYYDQRCRDYYYIDRDRRQYWENGQPRGSRGYCPR